MVQRYAHLSADHLAQWVQPMMVQAGPQLAAIRAERERCVVTLLMSPSTPYPRRFRRFSPGFQRETVAWEGSFKDVRTLPMSHIYLSALHRCRIGHFSQGPAWQG